MIEFAAGNREIAEFSPTPILRAALAVILDIPRSFLG